MAAHLVILAGPNGAGKSTLAPALLRDTFGLLDYVNADTLAAGLSGFRSEEVAFTAGRFVLMRLHSLAHERENFAFESTLAARSYATWIPRLQQSGYSLDIVFLWLHAPELAVQCVRKRVMAGGHGIPEAVIRRQDNQLHGAVSPASGRLVGLRQLGYGNNDCERVGHFWAAPSGAMAQIL